MASENFRFDFGEHFGGLIRECEAEFGFHGRTATEVREWQVPFRQSLRRVLGLANMERESGRLHARRGDARQRRPGLLRPRAVARPHRADGASGVLPAAAQGRAAQTAAGAHPARPRPSARLRRAVQQPRGGGADPRG